jgi:hypothetical protein
MAMLVGLALLVAASACTLGFVFSARPQDRASYFKALLEVTDLEDLRSAAAALEKDIAAPANPLIEKL